MKKQGVKKIMFYIGIGLLSLLILASGALFAASGGFLPRKYMEPWSKDYAKQFNDPRIRLAAYGLLAANGHNMQPWKIRLDKDDPMVFYLYADSSRLSKQVDPDSRQMMVSQGAFLEYISVAGPVIGFETDIRLFPDGSYNEQDLEKSMDTKPVAQIQLRKTEAQGSPLFNPMFLPDTNRAPYKQDGLSEKAITHLESLTGSSDLSVRIYDGKADLKRIGAYAMKGAEIEAGVARVMKESNEIFRPNEYQKNKYRYGFSVEGQGTSGIMIDILQGLVTFFPSMNSGKAASDLFIKSTRTSVNSTPAYAMITTADNSRVSQVKSGMLYSRLTLQAHTMGLAVQPLSQVLEEYPEMEEPYNGIHRDFAPGGGTIQMLVRIGKPKQTTPVTMRRDVMDLLQK